MEHCKPQTAPCTGIHIPHARDGHIPQRGAAPSPHPANSREPSPCAITNTLSLHRITLSLNRNIDF
jgi:hypothetical protein